MPNIKYSSLSWCPPLWILHEQKITFIKKILLAVDKFSTVIHYLLVFSYFTTYFNISGEIWYFYSHSDVNRKAREFVLSELFFIIILKN